MNEVAFLEREGLFLLLDLLEVSVINLINVNVCY